MALPMTTSLRSRALSRRDHVLNLLPPLTVVSKEDATMHDRLFADNPPAKNYPTNFPSKVMRHLGEWTFYSAPTKGELALLDKSMYDLEGNEEKTDKNNEEGKKQISQKTKEGTVQHQKHSPRTQSHKAEDDIKRLESRKEKTLRANSEKQAHETKEDGKVLLKETNDGTELRKPRLPEAIQRKSESNTLEKTKQMSRKKGSDIKTTKTSKRSFLTRAPKKLQKNTQVKSTKLQVPVAKVEITLKKSRGKVLGEAEAGEELSAGELTVEGHHVDASVPGPEKSRGQSFRYTVEGAHDAAKTDGHKENGKLNANKRRDSKGGNESRSSNYDYKTSPELDRNGDEKTTALEKTQMKNLKRSVIKIPLQENDSSEEVDNNREVTPHVDDVTSRNKTDSVAKSQDKADSAKSEEQCENAVKLEVSSDNLDSNLESDVLRDKHVTFSPVGFEKEQANQKKTEKKRPKSQSGNRKERKRSGQTRVKSG